MLLIVVIGIFIIRIVLIGIIVRRIIGAFMNQKQRADIGKRIRVIREELNKTQIEMSKILKVQQSAISKLEKGDITPTVDILLALNRISEKSIDWILCGD